MAKSNDVNYFDLFIDAAECSGRAAKMLRDIVTDSKVSDDELYLLHQIEHEGDSIHHKVISALSHAFITPIEREDIMLMSESIDSLTDSIEDIATRFNMFNITVMRPEALEFNNLIINACEAIIEALKEFKNFKKSKTINDMLIDINRLEEDGDYLYHKAVRRLFTESKDDLMEIIRWREAFDIMEQCCDACEDVADVIESIIMKNS